MIFLSSYLQTSNQTRSIRVMRLCRPAQKGATSVQTHKRLSYLPVALPVWFAAGCLLGWVGHTIVDLDTFNSSVAKTFQQAGVVSESCAVESQ